MKPTLAILALFLVGCSAEPTPCTQPPDSTPVIYAPVAPAITQGKWEKTSDGCQNFIISDGTIAGTVCPYIHDDFYACRGDGSCLNNTATMAAGKISLEKDLHLQESK